MENYPFYPLSGAKIMVFFKKKCVCSVCVYDIHLNQIY